MPSPDLLFQNLSTVQSKETQPAPNTITAAATIAPTNFLTFLSGTTAVVTITPPTQGVHTLAIVSVTTDWAGATTAGNILVASVTNSTLWQYKLNLFVYNPVTAKYYPSYAVHSTAV